MEILVVDDNQDICQLVESILISEGYDVKACCDPLKFESMIKDKKPKLIITDLMMSGIDGRALTRKIKENPDTEKIKIMMMSAHPDAEELSAKVNIDDFLTKPFEIDELVKKVEFLLQ